MHALTLLLEHIKRQKSMYPKDSAWLRGRRDPWGREYIYSSDGEHYLLMSFGADGRLGGHGADTDLVLRK